MCHTTYINQLSNKKTNMKKSIDQHSSMPCFGSRICQGKDNEITCVCSLCGTNKRREKKLIFLKK